MWYHSKISYGREGPVTVLARVKMNFPCSICTVCTFAFHEPSTQPCKHVSENKPAQMLAELELNKGRSGGTV